MFLPFLSISQFFYIYKYSIFVFSFTIVDLI